MKELFRWDEQKGAVFFTPSNRRVFMTNAHSWDAVERNLSQLFSGGMATLLSGMGVAYGRETALDYRSATGDPENVASYFEHLGLAAGWGKFSLSGDILKGSKLTVRVHDCVFCGSRNATSQRWDPCYFLMGVCKGLADTIFGFPHYVEETKCISKGDDSCQFLIRRAAGSERTAMPAGPNPPNDIWRR